MKNDFVFYIFLLLVLNIGVFGLRMMGENDLAGTLGIIGISIIGVSLVTKWIIKWFKKN